MRRSRWGARCFSSGLFLECKEVTNKKYSKNRMWLKQMHIVTSCKFACDPCGVCHSQTAYPIITVLRRVHQLEQTPICDLDWEQTPICVLNWFTNECDVCVLTLHSHFGFVFSILQWFYSVKEEPKRSSKLNFFWAPLWHLNWGHKLWRGVWS